ncbi:MAG: hypothetical protein ACE5GE_15795 [Phycisphaerae bacterium]
MVAMTFLVLAAGTIIIAKRTPRTQPRSWASSARRRVFRARGAFSGVANSGLPKTA